MHPGSDGKKKVLLYTDCPFLAGCENMPISLINSAAVHKKFEIYFVYRDSIRYTAALRRRLQIPIKEVPIRLPTVTALLEVLSTLPLGKLRRYVRAAVHILFRPVFLLYDVGMLFRVFRRIEPDIVHINNGGYPGEYSCSAAVFAARLNGIQRIIFVINNVITPYKNFLRYSEKPIDVLVKRNTTLFITGSKYARDALRELWGLPEHKAISIANTVMHRQIVESRDKVLERLCLSPAHFIIGNVALLEHRKGQRYLIEALGIVRKRIGGSSDIALIIEGEGPEKEYLLKLVEQLNLGDSVRFLQGEKNIFDIMNACDVFCLSSIEYEDFPNVVLEAMSLGKPVIGTRLAGIPEQIEDGENGFVVDVRNAPALAEAFLALYRDREKLRHMGQKSRERFERLFAYDKTISHYIGLYEQLMKESQGREQIKI